MLFPETPRVVYSNNPLIGVTCQLNFPAILKIDAETPAAFQERIRHIYPEYREQRGINLSVTLPPQLLQAQNAPLRMGNATYIFSDATAPQAAWTVSLTQTTLSVSTSRYTRWEDFKSHLAAPLEALLDVYKPIHKFSRVGLRYQNIIRRSSIGMGGVPWKKLIASHMVGLLAEVDNDDDVEFSLNQSIMKLNGEQRVHLQCGLAQDLQAKEQCYLIDSDFYFEEQTEPNHARDILETFHTAAGHLFRWSISDTLHSRLEPQPAD